MPLIDMRGHSTNMIPRVLVVSFSLAFCLKENNTRLKGIPQILFPPLAENDKKDKKSA